MRRGARQILFGIFVVAVFVTGLEVGSRYQPSDARSIQQVSNGLGTLQLWTPKDPTGFFTFLLVVVGGVQVGLFVWQLSLIRKSLDDAKIQAEAARGMLQTMRETAERQMRAYLYVEKTTFSFLPDGNCGVTFRIKNCGQTPAHKVKLQNLVKVVDWNDGDPEIPELTFDVDDIELLGSIAPSGDYYEYEVRSPEIIDFSTLVRDSTRAVYLVGDVSYATVFDTDQSTKFRYMIGGTVGWDSDEMFVGDEGNEAT